MAEMLAGQRQRGRDEGRSSGFLSILSRIARRLFRFEASEVVGVVEREGPDEALEAVRSLSEGSWRTRWQEDTSEVLEAVMDDAVLVTDKGTARPGFDVSNPANREFFDSYRLRLATQVTDTTREHIEAAIREGIDEGLSVPDVARKVREAGEEYAGYRSELISRTELHRAAIESSEIRAKNSGVVSGRTWLSASDERVRDTHRALNGVTVGLDEPFPGGIRSPAEEINCRCSLLFLISDEMLGEKTA